MALPSQPPKYDSWAAMVAPLKLGATGWPAYAIQCVVAVPADGVWGPQTDLAVKAWQKVKGLVADGIAGPVTQATMLDVVAAGVETRYASLPTGLLDGFARVEGANLLAPTNWSQVGGVDCGPVQWRQAGPPFDETGLRQAFNAKAAFDFAALTFANRLLDYARRNPSIAPHRRIQLAVLAHNAPFLSEQIVRYGHLLTPDAIATWTNIPVEDRSRYDGRSQYTHEEWSYEYPRRVLIGVVY